MWNDFCICKLEIVFIFFNNLRNVCDKYFFKLVIKILFVSKMAFINLKLVKFYLVVFKKEEGVWNGSILMMFMWVGKYMLLLSRGSGVLGFFYKCEVFINLFLWGLF